MPNANQCRPPTGIYIVRQFWPWIPHSQLANPTTNLLQKQTAPMLRQKMGKQTTQMGTEKCKATIGPLKRHTTPKAAKQS